jgi:HNH endonuclease
MTTEVIESKICTKCGNEKDLKEFDSNKSRPSGKSDWCKKCCSDYSKAYNKALREGRRSVVSGSMEDLRKKIKDNSVPDTSSGCLLWTSCVCKAGYGRLEWNGKLELVHRLSYMAFIGPIPEGKTCVCHICNRPACVNPLHLYPDTNKGNSEYMVTQGRQTKGEKNAGSKLTESDVVEILTLRYLCGRKQIEIADQFGTVQATISNICSATNWKYLDDIRFYILSMAGKAPAPDKKLSDDQFYQVMDVLFDDIRESTLADGSQFLPVLT